MTETRETKTLIQKLDLLEEFDRKSESCHKRFEKAIIDLLAFQNEQKMNKFVSCEFFSVQKPLTYISVESNQSLKTIEQKNEEKERNVEFFGLELNFTNRNKFNQSYLNTKIEQGIENKNS